MRWLVLLAFLPASAAALSCVPPNPARELDAMLREDRNPRLLIGTLTSPFDNPSLTYRFDGRLLAPGITIHKLSSRIDVSASCVASWCGELPRRPVEGVFIAEGTPQGLALRLDPCGGRLYDKPGDEGLGALERCIAGGRCSEADIGLFERP